MSWATRSEAASLVRLVCPERVGTIQLLDISPSPASTPPRLPRPPPRACSTHSWRAGAHGGRRRPCDLLVRVVTGPLTEWLLLSGTSTSTGFSWRVDRHNLARFYPADARGGSVGRGLGDARRDAAHSRGLELPRVARGPRAAPRARRPGKSPAHGRGRWPPRAHRQVRRWQPSEYGALARAHSRDEGRAAPQPHEPHDAGVLDRGSACDDRGSLTAIVVAGSRTMMVPQSGSRGWSIAATFPGGAGRAGRLTTRSASSVRSRPAPRSSRRRRSAQSSPMGNGRPHSGPDQPSHALDGRRAQTNGAPEEVHVRDEVDDG